MTNQENVNHGLKFLVLVDGSELGKRVLSKALRAKKNEDTLFVCHAVQMYDSKFLDNLYKTNADLADGYLRAWRDAGKAVCQQHLDECAKNQVTNVQHVVILSDDPKDEILKFAEDNHIDMIFVGPRGLGALHQAFLGSFSQYILNHSKCDVVLVKS
eukprot:c7309_g1_i1.p1 GENE.c7309_g1_i1~~c7309_g1_i1.p1  ORF type:complete len:157 (-),score=58.78 c7309_g1_i1:107-577(-)